MDFDCLDYILKKLDLTKFDESNLNSIRKRASNYK